MKCIYLTNILNGKRCGKRAFGLLGGNSYCSKHLDKEQSYKGDSKPTPADSYHAPQKSEIQQFREHYGRSPNKYEIIAML